MGVSGWLVWRRSASRATRGALALFGLQLSLNFAWSVMFFGFQRIDLALIDIVILFVAIVANMILFWRIERLATLLLVPYAAWVVFAIVLNVSIWLLNVT